VWLELREQWYLYGKPAGLESGGTNREQVAGGGGSNLQKQVVEGEVYKWQVRAGSTKENLLYSEHGESLK
jgi:hypothetical protein